MKSLRYLFSVMEAATLITMVLLILLLFSLLQKEIKRAYIKNNNVEITKISSTVETYIEENKKVFTRFLSMQDKAGASGLLMEFSDIYYCDGKSRITAIIKKDYGSQIFPGYDMSASALGRHLKTRGSGSPVSSMMDRSAESDTLSVYISAPHGGGYLVGRIGLESLRAGLIRIAEFTESIIIIATTDGYILSSSREPLPIHMLPAQSTSELHLFDNEYLFSKRHSTELNKVIAILTPLSEVYIILRYIQVYHVLFIFVFAGMVVLKIYWQSILIFRPLTAFSEIIRNWNLSSVPVRISGAFLRYEEIVSLYQSFQDKARQIQEAVQALSKSEELLRQLTENLHEVFYVFKAEPFTLEYVSPAYEEVWKRSRESLYQDHRAFLETVHPEDISFLKESIKDIDKGRASNIQYRIIWPDGIVRWIWSRTYPILNDEGKIYRIAGIAEDITEHKRIENLLRIERDLGIRLSSITDLPEALETIIKYALMIEGMDCGGIYLVDPDSGSIDLAFHAGLSQEFVKKNSHYDKESDRAHLVHKGEQVYIEYETWTTAEKESPGFDINLPEGIKCFALLPIQHMGISIACINIASKTYQKIPVSTRDALELIASITGNSMVRLRSQEQIRSSLREKEILLKEIHHRVKNNFQVITSLLNLHSKNIKNEELLGHFNDSKNRISAMALIHEKLYQSGNFASVDFAGYIDTLAKDLQRIYMQSAKGVQYILDAENIEISIDQAIPCSLIINEILSNAFKYAFPPSWNGKTLISISLHRKSEDMIELMISDTGTGLPKGIDPASTGTLGLSLIDVLTKQINGRLQLDSGNGTRYTITFPGKQ